MVLVRPLLRNLRIVAGQRAENGVTFRAPLAVVFVPVAHSVFELVLAQWIAPSYFPL